jgi:hypothetical protein
LGVAKALLHRALPLVRIRSAANTLHYELMLSGDVRKTVFAPALTQSSTSAFIGYQCVLARLSSE